MKRIASALYAVSAITVLAGAAVAPAMGEISLHFPDVNPILIQMIITLPSIMVIPCTMLSDRVCRRFGKKPVLIAGLLLYFAGGCAGGLANSIWLLLLSRAVLGIGMGTITPVCHSLPADYFKEDEKVSVIGRMSAFITIGAAICSVGAGWLAIISWRASFGIYAVSLFVLLLVLMFLPSPKRAKIREAKSPDGNAPLPGRVYLLGTTMFVYMAAFYAFPLGLAMHLDKTGIGDSRTAGYLFAFISVIAFAIGMYFPRFMTMLGRRLLPVLLLCMGGGYLGVAFAETQVQVWIGCSMVGIGLGGLTPLHYVLVNRAVSKESTVKAVSVVVAGTFAGQFASPFLLLLVEKLPLFDLGLYGSLGSAILVLGFLAIPLAAAVRRLMPEAAVVRVSSRRYIKEKE